MSVSNEIFLKDYTQPDYWIEKTDMVFEISSEDTIVTTELKLVKNKNTNGRNIFLNGLALELLEISLESYEYSIDERGLKFKGVEDSFILTTKVRINPYTNLSCEGLYKSGDILCTQCEAEGFRKITYYMDRPDVMSIFTVKIIADKKKFPFILANGNKIESEELIDGKYFTVWEDPHKKPAYLFALVAGDLGLVTDSYTTMSGRNVGLEIYVDKGNEAKCSHAMDSLKHSMKWDEDKFGLEYDLDLYMIVAVDSFNMGAMENKGLNIFNSSYVLASPETATDTDYQGIEAVIGHEYFHNWTGNRVTCRDWFQLTLKEGLTVFRDQEFSSDMQSRSVKRIEDVKGLRNHQFAEDAGPNSHPIKPKSFVEINNFYTATIYEKGAEVIRMIHTLIGAESFRKGMDLYFERHDGSAVTTEDFRAAMADASGVNLDQFSLWYDQNGTPTVSISTEYDQEKNTYQINIIQNSILNNTEYNALHMPFFFSLYTENGEKIDIQKNGKFELTEKETIITLDNIKTNPTPSWNTGFSAPVHTLYNYTDEELQFLMKYDLDTFNRYNAASLMYKKTLSSLIKNIENNEDLYIGQGFYNALELILKDDSLDSSYKAYIIDLPLEWEIAKSSTTLKLESTRVALRYLKSNIAINFKDIFLNMVESNREAGEFCANSISFGKRALKNVSLSYLSYIEEDQILDLLKNEFDNASNMTDEIGLLSMLIRTDNKYREDVAAAFYSKWKHETLVVQKWFKVMVSSEAIDFADIDKLQELETFDKSVPNILRSVFSALGLFNPSLLNIESGAGYKYMAQAIIDIDAYNPQMASRLATYLNHKSKLDDTRKKLLVSELTRVKQTEGLSSDTLEIINKNLS